MALVPWVISGGMWVPLTQAGGPPNPPPPPPPPVSIPLGATINPKDYSLTTSQWALTATTYDGYVGNTTAVTWERAYYVEGQWPAAPFGRISQLGTGCKFQVCMYPQRTLSTSEQVNMANQISILQRAGYTFDVVICTEPNIGGKFASATAYKTYLAYYAPVAANPAAFFTMGGTPPSPVNIIYNPAFGANPTTAVSYYPGDGYSGAAYSFYAICIDYYGSGWTSPGVAFNGAPITTSGGVTTYGSPVTAQNIVALADNSVPPKPFGISEFGSAAGSSPALTAAQFFDGTTGNPQGTTASLIGYLISFFTARALAGQQNYGLLWFNSGNSANTVTSGTDIKVPGIQALYTALT